jgi:hypothetical protein
MMSNREIKPGRCLTRIADPGKNFHQCVREYDHDGEHETDRSEPIEPQCGASRYGTGDNTHLCVRSPEHSGNHRTVEGEEFTNWTEPTPTAKPKPFSVEYDAVEGVLIAAALREKAKAERELAKELRVSYDGVGAEQADNRAGLLSLAADRIHKPVHEALVKDFDRALTKAEEQPFHAKLKRDIGLSW